jgi:hypothetical protein
MVIMTKLSRMLPWIGAAFAVAALASTMRRKGVLRGAIDAALDATPVVGGVKISSRTGPSLRRCSDWPGLAWLADRDLRRTSGRSQRTRVRCRTSPARIVHAIQNPPAAAVMNSTIAIPG